MRGHSIGFLEKYERLSQNYLQNHTLYGRMTCNFKSFSTVFQSDQDDGQMIMKDCVQWNPFTIGKILASGKAQTRDN